MLPCGLAADISKSEERKGFAGVSGGAVLSVPWGASRVQVLAGFPPQWFRDLCLHLPVGRNGSRVPSRTRGASLGLFLFRRNERQRQQPCPAPGSLAAEIIDTVWRGRGEGGVGSGCGQVQSCRGPVPTLLVRPLSLSGGIRGTLPVSLRLSLLVCKMGTVTPRHRWARNINLVTQGNASAGKRITS